MRTTDLALVYVTKTSVISRWRKAGAPLEDVESFRGWLNAQPGRTAKIAGVLADPACRIEIHNRLRLLAEADELSARAESLRLEALANIYEDEDVTSTPLRDSDLD